MTSFPDDRWYTPDHVWITDEGRVGVTTFLLGRARSVRGVLLPAVGSIAQAAQPIAELEGEKAIVEVYAPVGGTIVEVNDHAAEHVASDPFGAGWLLRIAAQPRGLLSADDYARRHA